MNAKQKKILSQIVSAAEGLKADIETLKEELEGEWDGKSARWQEGEKGEAAKELITTLTEAVGLTETVHDKLGEIEL